VNYSLIELVIVEQLDQTELRVVSPGADEFSIQCHCRMLARGMSGVFIVFNMEHRTLLAAVKN
jgi:hypothetical protein